MSAVRRGSVSTGVGPDDGDGIPEGPQGEAQRPGAQGGQVKLDALAHGPQIGTASIAVDLRPTCYARLALVPDHVARNGAPIVLVHGHRVRPGADNTHAALEYVEQLGQL